MGNIRVIGPRSSGKTTYLASLAYWPNGNGLHRAKTRYTIDALNDTTKELATNAENIILAGDSLEPTVPDKEKGIDALPFYSFSIEISHRFKKSNTINLSVRDYPGEIFDELSSSTSSSLHDSFITECLAEDVTGCLILLSEWTNYSDKAYARALDEFTTYVDRYNRLNDLRLAVAMSKCERGELWSGRLEPKIDLFGVHLPKTMNILTRRIPKRNLKFFALSTFGVLERNDPRPNRSDEVATDGRQSVLRSPKVWKPYGIISPLYWLSTGKSMNDEA